MRYPMPYYVYILLCKDGSCYTGHTKNLDSRLKQHALGKGARYTKIHEPDKLIYVEEFDTRQKAMVRERQIKKLTHKEKLELAGSFFK